MGPPRLQIKRKKKEKKNYIHYVEWTTQYSVLRVIDNIIKYIVCCGLLSKDLNQSCHGGKNVLFEAPILVLY